MALRIQAFWNRIDRRGADECWNWTGYISENGYGATSLGPKRMNAHRKAWILTHGPIPDGPGYHGTVVCHRCDNPACCNPGHLFLGTQQDNLNDMRAKGRRYTTRPEDAAGVKLTRPLVSAIRCMRKTTGWPQSRLASLFGVDHRTVSKVLLRRTWK
jgi:hypothetical protein